MISEDYLLVGPVDRNREVYYSECMYSWDSPWARPRKFQNHYQSKDKQWHWARSSSAKRPAKRSAKTQIRSKTRL